MDQIITKTLAEIYLQQGYLREAYEIFKALSEKDPSDIEIKMKLNELREKLGLAPSTAPSSNLSAEEKIRPLQRWLSNIQKRRKG